jgi:hypothetical protein
VLGVLALEDLGRDVVGRPAEVLEVLAAAEGLGHAEVNNLDVRVLGAVDEEEVVGLEVAMGDLAAVEGLEAEADLAKNLLGLLLGILTLLLDAIEQLTTLTKLHNQVELGVALTDVEEFDDVGVGNLAHNSDFIPHRLILVSDIT